MVLLKQVHRGVKSEIEITEPGKAPIRRSAFGCCHCSRICTVVPGSGIERGFCFMCMKPTCGQQKCVSCEPFEAKLEAMEGRRRFAKQLGGY